MELFNGQILSISQFSFNQYCKASSVQYALMSTLLLGTICFILTKVTHEYSWVDRIWPILPIIYGVHFLYHQNHCSNIPISVRQWVMIFFTLTWGLRLTYNFYRKGGFKKGGQDYRWEYLRKNYHWVLVELLNFFFIAYYQLILILWFSSPILNSSQGQFGLVDGLISVLWIILFIGEVIADQQQWNFQTEKYKLLKLNQNKLERLPIKYQKGFVTEGLFTYSRHPNFFCEICIWYVQFLFSWNSIGLNYCGIGAVLLNLLFLGSTGLTEKISRQKYPKYRQYTNETSRLIPLPPSKSKKVQ